LLDVGTGLADIPGRAASDCALTTFGVDEAASLLAAARGRVHHVTCANALALPFRDRSFDIVCCSQLLHHFEFADAERVLREMTRVARHAVVVSDLRRSWLAAGGFWLVSFPLAFHRVTRHDGVVSVLRGFTSHELSQLVTRATGVTPIVKHRLGFRLTAHWSPRST
jgi:ubiquinone/menaquinone biosynthesis C-methylase UbiE